MIFLEPFLARDARASIGGGLTPLRLCAWVGVKRHDRVLVILGNEAHVYKFTPIAEMTKLAMPAARNDAPIVEVFSEEDFKGHTIIDVGTRIFRSDGAAIIDFYARSARMEAMFNVGG